MDENNIRKLKVYRSVNSNCKGKMPSIRLDGKWLSECGFNIGDYIRVECRNEELFIRKDTERIAEEAAAKQQYSDMLSKMTKKEINALAESLAEYNR